MFRGSNEGRPSRRPGGGRGGGSGRGGFDGPRSSRSGSGRFGGRNRGFDGGQRGVGRRGSGSGSGQHLEYPPVTPEEWLVKLEKEGPQAFLDFSLCFAGTQIPFLKAMGIDLTNMSYVAGQEIHAIMIAACQSMIHGCMVYPDGSRGRKIEDHLLDSEASRLDAGG